MIGDLCAGGGGGLSWDMGGLPGLEKSILEAVATECVEEGENDLDSVFFLFRPLALLSAAALHL